MAMADVHDVTQGHAWRLDAEPFHALCGELQGWRTDPSIKGMTEGEKILGFVKGLRLSARLVYIIREFLPSGIEAHWGHILSPDGMTCSPECDVIVHRRVKHKRWNGTNKEKAKVMDFHFVPASAALAVVSCKSEVHSVDAFYPTKCRDYVDRVLLFAECCAPDRVARFREKAIEVGYAGFWYLYTMTSNDIMANAEDVWLDFVLHVKGVVNAAVGGST